MIRTKDTLMVPGFGSESDSEDDVDDDLMKDPTRNGSSAFLGLGKSLGPDAPTNYNYGRRRSRAVLYQLSGHYKNTEKSNKKIHSKLSTNVSWQFFFFCGEYTFKLFKGILFTSNCSNVIPMGFFKEKSFKKIVVLKKQKQGVMHQII